MRNAFVQTSSANPFAQHRTQSSTMTTTLSLMIVLFARPLARWLTHTLHPNATADMTDFDALIWLHFLQRMRYISFQSPPSAWSERTRAHTIKIKSIKGSTSSEREHSLATFMTSFFIWCSISIRTNINISFAFMVRQCSDYKKKKKKHKTAIRMRRNRTILKLCKHISRTYRCA